MNNKQAFTLIELLVVVLIIGILAAVALPQYRLAADKARLMNLLSMTQAVKQAEEIYYLANGTYTTDWTQLDIDFAGEITNNRLDMPDGKTLTLTKVLPGTGAANAVYATDNLLPDIILYHFYQHGTNRPVPACYADLRKPYALKLCQSTTRKTTRDAGSGSYNNVYYFD